MRQRGEAYDVSMIQTETHTVTQRDRKSVIVMMKEGSIMAGILPHAFIIMLQKRRAVMHTQHSIIVQGKEGIALSYRMKIYKAKAVCFHRGIVQSVPPL